MPGLLVVLNHSKLKRMGISMSAYELGSVVLDFGVGVDIRLLTTLQQELAKMTSREVLMANNSLICLDMASSPIVYEYLKTKGFIADQDRPDIAALLQEVDKKLKERSSTNYKMSQSQKDILLSVCEVYIDDIINNSPDYDTAIKLLRCAFFKNHNGLIAETQKLMAVKGIDKTVIDSISALWRFCNGEGNLETTYLRMNKSAPDLLIQRVVINDYCIAKLQEKFSKLDDENHFFMIMGILLFKFEQTLSPLADTNQIVLAALGKKNIQMETKDLGTVNWQPGVMPVTTRALAKMNILTHGDPDFERLRGLQKRLNSEVLQKYIHDIETNKRIREAEKNDPLKQGLMTNNKELVRAYLTESNVNIHFQCGRTPLILAIQTGDESLVQLVVDCKADVNQPNATRTTTPIGYAMGKLNPKIIQLLLLGGVDVFMPCTVVQVAEATYKFQKWEDMAAAVTPLEFALREYEKPGKEARSSIIKMLLRHNAGMGFKFKQHYPELDGAVLLGALYPESVNSTAITHLNFTLRVPFADYSHWRDVFKRTIASTFIPHLYLQAYWCENMIGMIERTIANKDLPKKTVEPSPIVLCVYLGKFYKQIYGLEQQKPLEKQISNSKKPQDSKLTNYDTEAPIVLSALYDTSNQSKAIIFNFKRLQSATGVLTENIKGGLVIAILQKWWLCQEIPTRVTSSQNNDDSFSIRFDGFTIEDDSTSIHFVLREIRRIAELVKLNTEFDIASVALEHTGSGVVLKYESEQSALVQTQEYPPKQNGMNANQPLSFGSSNATVESKPNRTQILPNKLEILDNNKGCIVEFALDEEQQKSFELLREAMGGNTISIKEVGDKKSYIFQHSHLKVINEHNPSGIKQIAILLNISEKTFREKAHLKEKIEDKTAQTISSPVTVVTGDTVFKNPISILPRTMIKPSDMKDNQQKIIYKNVTITSSSSEGSKKIILGFKRSHGRIRGNISTLDAINVLVARINELPLCKSNSIKIEAVLEKESDPHFTINLLGISLADNDKLSQKNLKSLLLDVINDAKLGQLYLQDEFLMKKIMSDHNGAGRVITVTAPQKVVKDETNPGIAYQQVVNKV